MSYGTAGEKWESILSEDFDARAPWRAHARNFCHPKKCCFFTKIAFFFIFQVEISSACALEFSQSMDSHLSNAVSHASIRCLVILLASFEIPHKIEKKRAGLCPAVLKDFLHQNSNSRLWVAHETNYFKSNRAKPEKYNFSFQIKSLHIT